MGEKIKQLSRLPIYGYLYGLAFLTFKTSAFLENFELVTALLVVAIFFAITYLLNQLFFKFTGTDFSKLFTLLIWMSIFHVVGIAQVFGYPYAYIPVQFYIGFYACVLAIILFLGFVLKKKVYPDILSRIINVFLGITICVFLTNGIKSWYSTLAETIKHQHEILNSPHNNQKDIVWILMDEYGSSVSLKSQMGFDNPMDKQLEERGFQVFQHAKSRFNNTLYSVNSIFNLDDSIKPSSYYKGIKLLSNSKLVPTLEKEGYRFVNLGFFDISGHEMIADRSGYPHTYLQQIVSGTLPGMMYNNWKNSIAKCDAYNQQVLKLLSDSLQTKSSQNRFIWAHITIPHEPFCRDSLGRLQKEDIINTSDSNLIRKQYLSYLNYGNKQILQLLDHEPAIKNKIVIISGDHGPRYPYLKNKALQLNPFLAIYLPENTKKISFSDSMNLSSIPLVLF